MEEIHTSAGINGAAAGSDSFLVYNSIKRNIRTPCFVLLVCTLNMSLLFFFFLDGEGGDHSLHFLRMHN